MRIALFDEYEFDSPDSEQSLAVATAQPGRRRGVVDLEHFYAATCVSPHFGNAGPLPSFPVRHFGQLTRSALDERAGIGEVRADQVCHVIEDAWDHFEVVFRRDDLFVRYCWITTA